MTQVVDAMEEAALTVEVHWDFQTMEYFDKNNIEYVVEDLVDYTIDDVKLQGEWKLATDFFPKEFCHRIVERKGTKVHKQKPESRIRGLLCDPGRSTTLSLPCKRLSAWPR